MVKEMLISTIVEGGPIRVTKLPVPAVENQVPAKARGSGRIVTYAQEVAPIEVSDRKRFGDANGVVLSD